MKVFTQSADSSTKRKTIVSRMVSLTMVVGLLFCSMIGSGQILAWQFGSPAANGDETTYNATTNNTNLNTSTLSRGAGITAIALGRAFSASNFPASGTKANAISNNRHFQFSISAKSGFKVSLSTLDVRLRRTSTGPNAYIWRYSTDGTNFTDIGSDISFTSTTDGVDQTQLDLSGISALQNVATGTTITLRLVAWGASATGGTFAIGRYGTGVTTNSLSIGGTVASLATAPTVLTTTATSITTTGASSGGNVTSDGGASLSARGVVYGTGAGPTIAGTKTTDGTTTGAFTSTLSGLLVNTQYFYRAYATNNVNTSYGAESSFYTLANTPGTPTVNGATTSTLDVTLDANSNPSTTQFAIQETGGNYVQANGTLGGTAVWQTAATWGTKTVTGLSLNTSYGFKVKARNGANAETAFGSTASLYTLAATPAAPTVVNPTSSTLDVSVNANSNPSGTTFAIQETGSNNYVQADGTLGGTVVWQTAAVWGTKTVTGLSPLTSYTFQVKARNGDNLETAFGGTASETTLSAAAAVLSATGISTFGAVCTNTTAGPNSFTVSGTNLTTADVTVGPLTGYTFSTDDVTYTASLSIAQGGGTFSQLVYVKFTPTLVQSYTGNVSIGGGGASSINAGVTGNGINTAPTVTAGAATGVGISTATVPGTIIVTGCSAISAYGVEYSTTASFANGNGTPVAGSNLSGGSFSVALSGLATGTTFYYHTYATNAGGTSYSAEGSFTTLTPTLSVDALTGFGNVCTGTTAGPNTFTITGTNLSTADVTVATLNGFTYSTDDITYTTSLSISQPGGSFSQLIYVKFSPTLVQSYSNNIVVGGAGAASVNRSVTATGINTPVSVTTGSSSGITQVAATANGSLTEGCSSVTAYGIEYSTTNGFTNGTGTQVASSNLSAGSFSSSLSGLNPGVTYYYKAYATDNSGTVYGSQQSFATLALDAPIATAATGITSSSFNANWNAVTGASSYRLDVSTSSTFYGAATTLAGWSFPTSGTVVTPDVASANNTAKTLTTTASGGISSTAGATTLAATANSTPAWQSGSGSKYWQVDINTTGFYNIKVSSKQRSSGTGPRDFKLQYRLGAGTWSDVTGGSLTLGDNFTAGVLSNLALPSACDNQTSISVRWIMTTNTSVGAGTVAATGSSRIDDIIVSGEAPLFVSGYENLTVNALTQSVTGLSSGTSYYYRVRAFSTTSTSANSNTITAVTCTDLPVSVSIAASTGTTICDGTPVTFTATPTNGGGTPAYQWYNGASPISGETAATYTTSTLVNGDALSVILTSSEPCTTGNPATSNTITMTVNPLLPVSVSIAASTGTTICNGTSVTFTATPTNGGTTPSYQWYNGVTPISGETAATYTSSTLVNGDAISVQLTSNEVCTSGNPATSNTITMTVNPNLPVSVSIAANPGNTICEGISVTFTATPTNGGSTPAYQWYNGASPISGETAATYTSSALVNGDDISVQLTSNEVCTSGNPATSNNIVMTVNANLPVSVSIAANPGNTICAGTTVTFTATPTNGGSTPTYQWYNGVSAISGETAATYTTSSLVNGAAISVVMTSNITPCATGNPATSNTITMTVNQAPATPGAISGPTDACPLIGLVTPTTYSISAVANAVTYNWTVPVGVTIVSGQGTTSLDVTFDNTFALTNSQFKVSATSAEGCTSAQSALIVLKNIPGIPVAISGPTNACEYIGQPTTATYTIAAVQYATSYTWTVQGTGISLVSGQGTTSVEVSYATGFTSGSVRVTANSNCGNRSPRSLSVARLIPTAPVAINGPANSCAYINTNTEITYSIDPVANATSYTWTLPANVTLVSGQGTTSINVKFLTGYSTSIFKVKSVSNCFTSGDRQLTVTAASTSTPGAVTGPNNACVYIGTANIATYTIRKVNSAIAYNWVTPTGATITSHPGGAGVNDTIITVAFDNSFVTGTNIQVQAINCNTSSPRSFTIYRNNAATPGLINGPVNVCEYIVSATNPTGTTATYKVAKASSATSYTWTAPANATITAHPGGSGVNDTIVEVSFNNSFTTGAMQVYASNGCGNSSVRSLSLSRLNPGTPGGIDVIQAAVCPEREYTYSLAAMPSNATSILWTIPATGTIITGQGTISITVSYPATPISGTVTATAYNNCGNSVTRSLTIKLAACLQGKTTTVEFARGTTPAETLQAMDVQVFPNPTASQFNLQVSTSAKDLIKVRLLDMSGRELKRYTVSPFEKNTIGADLKAGSYLLEVTQGGNRKTEKLIKF